LNPAASVSIPVGVVVERLKATSPWLDFVWRPVAVLSGLPAAQPWTPLGPVGDTTSFFAGTATVALYRTETANYIDNLSSGAPLLWVALRATDTEPPYQVAAVTADPAEGEAFTEAGNDLVDSVPMPEDIRAAVEAFIAEHHVERVFHKRQRDGLDAGPPADGRGPRGRRR
jgi:uncharacterized protein DUF3305